MTALDNIKAALEEVSSSGAWHKSGPAIDIDESDDWPVARVEVRANRLINRKIAAFIAACNPSAIRELLAYVESLEAKTQAAENALNQCASWNEGPDVGSHFDEPGAASIAREYFAAMEQTK